MRTTCFVIASVALLLVLPVNPAMADVVMMLHRPRIEGVVTGVERGLTGPGSIVLAVPNGDTERYSIIDILAIQANSRARKDSLQALLSGTGLTVRFDTASTLSESPALRFRQATDLRLLADAGSQLEGVRTLQFWTMGLAAVGGLVLSAAYSDTSPGIRTYGLGINVGLDIAALACAIAAIVKTGKAGTALRRAAVEE